MSSKPKTPATKEEAKVAGASSSKARQKGEQDAPTTLVPKLRFPEFREAEEWRFTTLDSVCEILNNRRRPITGNERTPGPYPYYGASGIVDHVGDFIFDERLLLVGEDGAKWGAFEKTAFIADGKYWVNNHAHVLKPFAANDTLLENYLTMQDLSPFVTGAAPPKLTLGKLRGIPVPLPPKPAEQQKIAECLSSVDELMAAQSRKVDALKTHKKGLMQQLFPREGETQPRLRFPEFQDAGEWEVRELTDFITERNQYPKEKVPLFSLTIVDGVTPKTERYERSFLVNDESDAYKLVLPNDFAFNPMNLRFGAIGRHSGTEKVAVSKYYNIFSCDSTVDSRFCEIYFRSDGMVAFYDDMAIGSLIEKRRVHFAAFLKFNIRFPRLLEQQRIADCLFSLDALITAETQKLEALKTHKKAMMQQLFPSPEEIES